MKPIFLLAPIAAAAAYALRRQAIAAPSTPTPTRPETTAPPVPSNVIALMTDAIRSGNPSNMRDAASTLDSMGFRSQAEDLRRAADAVERAVRIVPEPPAGTRPVPPGPPAREEPPIRVERPPPNARPVTPEPPVARSPGFAPPPASNTPPRREPAREEPPIQVTEPPPNTVPVAPPSLEDRLIPPGTEELVAAYARMIYDSAPRGPVADLDLSERFKRATGVRGDKRFYGQGPALALLQRGVVPPNPWDWQASNVSADKASYVRQLKQAKLNDPARADLYDERIASV